MRLRRWLRNLSVLGVTALITPAVGQTFGDRPLQLVVPYGAGGSTDVIPRMVLPATLEALGGVSGYVQNRAGANGNIGTLYVARSKPDGNTLLLGGIWLSTNPSLYPDLPYDPARDFVPVTLLATVPVVMVINQDVPAKTLEEFIQYAQENPGKMNFGSSGVSGHPYLVAELFKRATKTNIVHVPYPAIGQALTDVVAGRIQLLFIGPSSVKAFIESGKLRGLAVTGQKRADVLPDVPTFRERGIDIPGLDNGAWWGVLAPAGTPKAAVDTLNRAFNKALLDDQVRSRLIGGGLVPDGSSPEEFGRLIQAQTDVWGPLIKELGVKVQ